MYQQSPAQPAYYGSPQAPPASVPSYPANNVGFSGYGHGPNGFAGASGQRSQPGNAYGTEPATLHLPGLSGLIPLGLLFKDSPFYDMLAMIGDVKTIEGKRYMLELSSGRR